MKSAMALSLLLVTHSAAAEAETALWHDKTASFWLEALPVGNGRMGAMVYGGTHQECIPFDEKNLWTGTDRSQDWLDPKKPNEGIRLGAMGDYPN